MHRIKKKQHLYYVMILLFPLSRSKYCYDNYCVWGICLVLLNTVNC